MKTAGGYDGPEGGEICEGRGGILKCIAVKANAVSRGYWGSSADDVDTSLACTLATGALRQHGCQGASYSRVCVRYVTVIYKWPHRFNNGVLGPEALPEGEALQLL